MTDDLVRRLKGHSEIMERDKGKVVRFIDVATCTEAADRIEALTAENFKLAAGSCDVEGGKVGDEHGHFYCTLQKKVEAQAAEIERLREENLQLRSEMTMIELDSFDAYDDWCLRGLPEEAIGFADRTHQRAKAVLLGGEYDGD